MKPGPLVSFLALHARVDEKTLSVLVRALRDADILEKGGRGPSGIEVDCRYLAKILIARMATDKPARAVQAFHNFSGMQLVSDQSHQYLASLLPDPNHTLLDFVSRICDPQINLKDAPEFEVAFVGNACVHVSRNGRSIASYADMISFQLTLDQMMDAEIKGDAEREHRLLERVAMGDSALIGIVESRSFTSSWLQVFKNFVFADQGGG